MKFWSLFQREREYRVSVDGDALTPEETLFDSTNGMEDLERQISPRSFHVTLGVVGALLLVIGVATIRLSVFQHSGLSAQAERNRSVQLTLAPVRGTIFDRTGTALVTNVPSFRLVVVNRELSRNAEERQGVYRVVSDILKTDNAEFARGLEDVFKKRAVAVVATDLTKDQVVALRQAQVPGFVVITSAKREYQDGPKFSTVIGYAGRVSSDDLSADSYYDANDSIGRLGIEGQYEQDLRGTHGVMSFAADAEGLQMVEAQPGNNVVLAIDAEAQKRLWSILYQVMIEAKVSSSAAVVQDPRNGEVLAMVSFPAYDNNLFESGVSQDEYRQLFSSRLRPLFNRVIGGLYNPGSTIKPFIGLAALHEKVITPRTAVQDCVSISVPNPINPSEPYVFKNWRAELGLFDLRRAIANSCNVFFYTAGGGFGSVKGLGVERIVQYLKKAFTDTLLGVDLPGEDHGFVPTPEWKEQERGEPWYQGDTYNISIGQGDLLVTPLWINSYVSAIANGGKLFQPRVATTITDIRRDTIRELGANVLTTLPFTDQELAEMRADMHETVVSGTAKSLSGLPVSSAAKTGTAEVIKGQRINSLFTAFAPLDNAQVAITVLIEGSVSNEGYATRTAREFLEWYFAPR